MILKTCSERIHVPLTHTDFNAIFGFALATCFWKRMSSTIRSTSLLLQAPPEISWDKHSQVRNGPRNYLAAAAFLWVLVFLLASLCPTKQPRPWCPSSPCGTSWDGLATAEMLAMDNIQVFPILPPVCLPPAPATQHPAVQSLWRRLFLPDSRRKW